MSFITELLNQYGYIVLYLSLFLELIGLPLPGELLMTYCGFLVFKGDLNFTTSIICATAGVISGITLSYFVGKKLGEDFFYKHGHKFHMGKNNLNKMSGWMNKYGNGLLIVAYFIPGVRHITGYFSGIMKLSFRKFSINAYLGATIWSFTFILIGKILGVKWDKFSAYINKYFVIGCIIVVVLLLISYMIKKYWNKIIKGFTETLELAIRTFNSLEIKFIVLISIVLLIVLGVLFIYIIQKLITNKLVNFDTIISYVLREIFTGSWLYIFQQINKLTSIKILVAVTILMIIFIVKEDKDELIELKSLIVTILGGELFSRFISLLFHEFGVVKRAINGNIVCTLPSNEALMSIIVYGFIVFVITRNIKNKTFKNIVVIIGIVICILSGISPIIIGKEYPTDIILGYVLGGLWLSLNIMLLEVFRGLSIKEKDSEKQILK